MRIVSQFRDFYDSAMGHGIDTEKVWMRKEELIPLRFPLKYRSSRYLSEREGVPHFFLEKQQNMMGPYIGSYLILLAGELYPGVEVVSSYLDSAQHFYDLEPLIRYVAKHNMSDLLTGWRQGKVEKETIQDIKDLFDLKGSEMLRDFAITHRISIATDWSHHLNNGTREKILTVNPSLVSLQFQKCLDPITTYQKLEMWIGGVLTEPDRPEPVPDTQKIINHGFDVKTSFRKGKQDEKRGRV